MAYGRGEHHLSFGLGRRELICRILEGTFPDYERVIAKDNDKKVLFNRKHLVDAVQRAALMTGDRARAVLGGLGGYMLAQLVVSGLGVAASLNGLAEAARHRGDLDRAVPGLDVDDHPAGDEVLRLGERAVDDGGTPLAVGARALFLGVQDAVADRDRAQRVVAAIDRPALRSHLARTVPDTGGVNDVPLLIPEINHEHVGLIETQRQRRGFGKGFIVTNPNCAVASFAPPLAALHRRVTASETGDETVRELAALRATATQLGDTLGLRVIIAHTGSKGTVTLHYSSIDQLDMVCQRLSGERI